ncbi:hypothetical protein O181_066706 [Austropuccinia psidii MF-1]|uniref:Mitochondrial distribution and morphology protein 35 n=1 Tax=Austropuccinia psidii MF-1 TaxID=1389203 RepID=A0A9Q3I2F0_9BASI|nr:hypothetical protein [Austropuccinia psidii MF-1]
MDSLEPTCTPLKKSYDACFNQWFEKYLDSTAKYDSSVDLNRTLARGKEQYERDCGEKWRRYQSCLQEAIKSRQLQSLLEAARKDDPLIETKAIEEATNG